EWVARTIGDGLGFDVLSFNEANGAERLVEGKTTVLGQFFPFLRDGQRGALLGGDGQPVPSLPGLCLLPLPESVPPGRLAPRHLQAGARQLPSHLLTIETGFSGR